MKFLIISVVLFVLISDTTNAYVTNNNHNKHNGKPITTTTTPPKTTTAKISHTNKKAPPSIMDWLPKNAFLPKSNLQQIQEQVLQTVLNIQLDLPTTRGLSTSTKTTTVTKTFDPNQELVGWRTTHQDKLHSKHKKDMIKSSHLLLQRSTDVTPRLPIKNLQLMLSGNIRGDDKDLAGHSTSTTTSSSRSSNTKTKEPKTKKATIPVVPLLPMPGYHGSHPILSSGILPLTIQNCGEYITLQNGIQSLPLSKMIGMNEDTPTTLTTTGTSFLEPQWEIIWKEHSPTGTIVCGIELQRSISRNNDNAIIPAGIMYISFPIWDGTQLIEYQNKKVQYDLSAKLYSNERDHEMIKMMSSTNIFNKMMHYKNAITAAENYSLQPHKMYRNVPTSISDLIAIRNENDNNDDDDVAPVLYIDPKGKVRIVPNTTMKQMTSSTPCGKQMVHSMIWSSNNSKDSTLSESNGILHGTAKIIIPSLSSSQVAAGKSYP